MARLVHIRFPRTDDRISTQRTNRAHKLLRDVHYYMVPRYIIMRYDTTAIIMGLGARGLSVGGFPRGGRTRVVILYVPIIDVIIIIQSQLRFSAYNNIAV